MSDSKTKTKTTKAPAEPKTKTKSEETTTTTKAEETKPKTTKAKAAKAVDEANANANDSVEEKPKAKKITKAKAAKEPKAVEADESDVPATKSKKRGAKADADGGYPKEPKKALTGYTFFFQDRQADVIAKFPDLTFGDRTRKISDEWQSMSEKEKAVYLKKQADDKKRYEKDMAKWVEEVTKMGGDPEAVKRSAKESKRSKREKKEVHYDLPSKPANPYVLFGKDKRVQYENMKLTFAETNKKLAEDWKNASDADKKKYQDLADQDKVRYDEEMKKFYEENPDAHIKKKKKTKEEGYPTKARNAYILFTSDVRDKLKAKNPGMAPTVIVKEMGKMWNDLSEADKGKYDEMAKKDRERFESELAKFQSEKTKTKSKSK